MINFFSDLKNSFKDASEITGVFLGENPGYIADVLGGYFPFVVASYILCRKENRKDVYEKKN